MRKRNIYTFISSSNHFIHLKICFKNRTPNVTAIEYTDSNGSSSEFNPAYSFELTSNPTQCEVDTDTYDHILEVTSQHEAVYAYYYMDDNNKVSANNSTIIRQRFFFSYCYHYYIFR